MLSVNFLKLLLYLLTGISLLMGHFSVRSTAAFILSLSCSTSSQSYIVRSIVCSSFLHEHVGLSMILYLYKYDLILPRRVTKVVKFGVTIIFSFNLSAILGKYNFVIAPFVVQSHSVCYIVIYLIRIWSQNADCITDSSSFQENLSINLLEVWTSPFM